MSTRLLSIQSLLREQRDLSAVQRFAELHDRCEVPSGRLYRDIVPLSKPGPGQQYAFEVDLDACTGCKACVSACHSLNGLDEDESFRSVGLLHGGTAAHHELRTVSTSCHHCVDPACLSGCPVKAYEKDPVTGIVKHLDDQCIGCQYCTLMCPYDAPKYSPSRGIVRKCDMCSSRLAVGEAPACVQACPNGAIAIRVVEQTHALELGQSKSFLPGAPTPEHTLPTTRYRAGRETAANVVPADFYRTGPEHAHPPLVVLLTLTQLAVGALAISFGFEAISKVAIGAPAAQAITGFAFGAIALGASLLHLGRPQYAFRAVLGLATSWLSREAIAFGVFAKFAALYAVARSAAFLPEFPGKDLLIGAGPALGATSVLLGAFGVLSSVMVYAATRRAHWRGTLTGTRFGLTTILLGAATALAVGRASSSEEVAHATALVGIIIASATLKLSFEARLLNFVRSRQDSNEKRMALVMAGELRPVTLLRFGCGLLGGLLLPAWILVSGASNVALPVALALSVILLLGELSERYLFFAAAPASRMPGGLR